MGPPAREIPRRRAAPGVPRSRGTRDSWRQVVASGPIGRMYGYPSLTTVVTTGARCVPPDVHHVRHCVVTRCIRAARTSGSREDELPNAFGCSALAMARSGVHPSGLVLPEVDGPRPALRPGSRAAPSAGLVALSEVRRPKRGAPRKNSSNLSLYADVQHPYRTGTDVRTRIEAAIRRGGSCGSARPSVSARA